MDPAADRLRRDVEVTMRLRLLLFVAILVMVSEIAEARFMRRCRGPATYPVACNTLTPERCKAALLEMMHTFDPHAVPIITGMKIWDDEDGWYAWSAFRFHPGNASYRLTISPARGAHACIFEYKGTFEWKDGRLVATPPQLVSAALQRGE
jgi:hypothetical protein